MNKIYGKKDIRNPMDNWMPMCAKCNKPVDRIEYQALDYSFATKFRVYCHGEVEEFVLSRYAMVTGEEIKDYRAFTDEGIKELKRIEEII